MKKNNSTTNRRNFIKNSALGTAGILSTSMPLMAQDSANIFNSDVLPNINLGVASYTLRNFTIEKALDMTLRCGINRISFKSMHLPLDSGLDTIKETVKLCKEKGIDLYGGGVIYMKSQAEVDQAFAYAKAAEMKIIIGVPNHELLEYVESKVKETDIKLAIHNHGPGDELYPSPESAYVKIKNMDSRMGLCIDIGHTIRIGRDPSKDFESFFDRVYDVHLKDVTKAAEDGETCIIGRGVIDIPSFIKTAVKLNYKETLSLEYEAESSDPLPGMMESLGYIKGILATI